MMYRPVESFPQIADLFDIRGSFKLRVYLHMNQHECMCTDRCKYDHAQPSTWTIKSGECACQPAKTNCSHLASVYYRDLNATAGIGNYTNVALFANLQSPFSTFLTVQTLLARNREFVSKDI